MARRQGWRGTLEKVMIATDFSERSDRALRRATLLAKQFRASLVIVHAVDDDQPAHVVESEREIATDLLREMRASLRSVDSLDCEARVVLGDAFEALREAVEAEAPDLLVIGPHRRRLLRDIFIGTTAERTIRSVACPVLMVNAVPAGPYRHVLQTTDLSDGSRVALQRFARLGIGQAAQNAILHIFDVPELSLAIGHTLSDEWRQNHLETARKRASSQLAHFLAGARLGEVETILRHELTAAPHEIRKQAADDKADLIVLATHGRSGLAGLLIGSVTEQVLRVSEIDVLAIPPEQPA